MFVVIDNQDMDVLEVEEWIKTNRDANGGDISPEFAMEILTKTNHFAHIKKVINHIRKNCLDENGELATDKVLAYKDFILSSVDGREMSPQALEILQEMADAGGLRKEFDEANDWGKIYEIKDCENVNIEIVKSKVEFYDLEDENLRVFFDADSVYLSNCNLDKIQKLRFRAGAEVDLYKARNLPKDLDVSMCSTVGLSGCDLEGIRLKFREGAEVFLWGSSNLSKDLDVSMCSKVYMRDCDLSRVERIRFKDKKQEEEFMDGARGFSGKVEYVEEKGKNMANGHGGMEM